MAASRQQRQQLPPARRWLFGFAFTCTVLILLRVMHHAPTRPTIPPPLVTLGSALTQAPFVVLTRTPPSATPQSGTVADSDIAAVVASELHAARVICGEVELSDEGIPVVNWATERARRCSTSATSSTSYKKERGGSVPDAVPLRADGVIGFEANAATASDKHAVSANRAKAHGEKMRTLAMETFGTSGTAYADQVYQYERNGIVGSREPLIAGQTIADALRGLTVANPNQHVREDAGELEGLHVPCGHHTVALVLLLRPALKHFNEEADDLHTAARVASGKAWTAAMQCVGGGVLGFSIDKRGNSLAAARYTAARFTKLPPLPQTCSVTLNPAAGKRAATPALLRVSECRGVAQVGNVDRVDGESSWSCGAVLRHKALRITAALKYGTKTAIYKGIMSGDEGHNVEVVVKQFNVLQYASFTGFRRFVAGPAVPNVNVPTITCFAADFADSVFQVQEFVPGVNLKKFIKSPTSDVTWAQKLDLMLQIACIFRRLHAHPQGPFAFDDNHPEQYMVQPVESSGGLHFNVTLIDIDTLQQATPKDVERAALPLMPRRGEEAQFTTKCRCFFCRGRSNCMFINTPEGYLGCGQSTGLHGDREDPAAVLAGRQCHLASDSWFLAQLFIFIVDGHVVWEGVDHEGVIRKLGRSELPTSKSKDAPFNAMIKSMLRDRMPPAAIVDELIVMCRKYECPVSSCPNF